MPRYFPVDVGVSFDCVPNDIGSINWGVNGLAAEFLLPSDATKALRVTFSGITIVRLLDEMPLSTEVAPAEKEGLVPNHFAYRVTGALFAETQSQAWKEIYGPVAHYEFITGWGCMDLLSPSEPTFEVVVRS